MTIEPQTIAGLVALRREGDYWDFKGTPHSNNSDLLHDILCMSNSLHPGCRYIILGVSDSKNGCELIGLSRDQPNRKTQSDLLDFLSSKKFAGDIRPEVELQTICLEQNLIDVICIYDNSFKPYYVTEDYRTNEKVVRAHHIYTRIGDKNTPKCASADIFHVEKMWRQRFTLDLTPLERMKSLLKRHAEWFRDIGNKDYAYHNQFPEFRIQFSPPKDHADVYCYFYPNERSFYGHAKFMYRSTILFELPYVYCDEMRIMLPAPYRRSVRIGKDNFFYYYVQSDLNGHFLHWLTNGSFAIDSRGSAAPMLIIRGKEELEEFEAYLSAKADKLDQIHPGPVVHVVEAIRRELKMSVDPLLLSRIKSLHTQWLVERGCKGG